MRYLLFASFLVLNLCGCSSSKVASNKDPNFNQKLSKVYLILKTPKYSKDFKEQFQKTFLDELAKRNVLCFYESPGPLALETEADVQKRIAEAAPDVVITFTQTEGMVSTSGNSGWMNNHMNNFSYSQFSSVFDVKMFVPNTERAVWRANIDVSASGDVSEGGQKTAKKLIAQLVKDGLI